MKLPTSPYTPSTPTSVRSPRSENEIRSIDAGSPEALEQQSPKPPSTPRLRPTVPETILLCLPHTEIDFEIPPINLRPDQSPGSDDQAGTLRSLQGKQILQLPLRVNTHEACRDMSMVLNQAQQQIEHVAETLSPSQFWEQNPIHKPKPSPLTSTRSQRSPQKPKPEIKSPRKPRVKALYQPWKRKKSDIKTPHKTIRATKATIVAQTRRRHGHQEEQHQRERERLRRLLQDVLTHLSIPLAPLVSVTTGLAHPRFPRSVLEYHLLTHENLDSLARWYHQTHDAGPERFMYPVTIQRAWTFGSIFALNLLRDAHHETDPFELEVDLATKRRRFGRFMGLRGCESPVEGQPTRFPGEEENTYRSAHFGFDDATLNAAIRLIRFSSITATTAGSSSSNINAGDDGNDADDEIDADANAEEEESVDERMEREWRRALKKAEDERNMQEKLWRGYG